jgi:enolase
VDAALIALDGTPNKARLGGNAIVATSMAIAHAAAAAQGLPLWRYLGAAGKTFSCRCPRSADLRRRRPCRASRRCAGLHGDRGGRRRLRAGAGMDRRGVSRRRVADGRGRPARGVADEGGWWPAFDSNEAALDFLLRAIERAGYTPGQDVAISLDIAASDFGRKGEYTLARDGREHRPDGLAEMLLGWLARYPIVAIEDPLAEDDAEGLRKFTAAAATRSRSSPTISSAPMPGASPRRPRRAPATPR